MTFSPIELVLRSSDATWNRGRWEKLEHDGNRYEVIDGTLYWSTMPSPLHQWISYRAERLLYAQIDDSGLGFTLHAPVGLFMPGCDPVQPDVLVLHPRDGELIMERRIETIPLLLIEILSPSSVGHDLVTKQQAYARAGVAEYWVLRPQERDVLLHSEPDAALGQFLQVTHISADGELVSPTLPFRAPVAAFFAAP